MDTEITEFHKDQSQGLCYSTIYSILYDGNTPYIYICYTDINIVWKISGRFADN